MTQVYVKLMAKGLKSHEHDMFAYTTSDNSTIQHLIDDLYDDFKDRFEIYLDDIPNRKLRRDAIVILNGANMVSKQGVDTQLSNGDLIVFMIAAVGG